MKDIDDSIQDDLEETKDDRDSIHEENPEWDGSESELVADDDAESYEIPETGIKISYVMTREEMVRCLYHSNIYKTKGSRAVFASVLFGAAAVIFVVAYFTTNQYQPANLFFSIFSLVMIVLIWLVPFLHIRSMAKVMANGKTIEAEVYPDHIDIGQGAGAWEIDLDGNCELMEFDNIFMIALPDGRNFAIPERVIEPEIYNEFKAILIAGTKPQDE